MKENQRMLITIGVAVLAIGLIVLVAVLGGKKGSELVTEVTNAKNGNDPKLIMIGYSSCQWCQKLHPVLDEYKESYGFDYIYVDTDKISSKQLDKITDLLGIDELGTPYMGVVGNGKVIDKQEGYVAEEDLFKFLQDNHFIDAKAKLPLNYITTGAAYQTLIESKDKKVIVIGQTGCDACVKGKPALNEIATEHKIEINYVNMKNLSEKDQKVLLESFDIFDEEWGTPLMLVVQDKKIIDKSKGFINKGTYVNFLIENGFIKE